MKIAVVYIYPFNGANGRYDSAFRFLHSYHNSPTIIEHSLIIASNGEQPSDDTRLLFSSVPNHQFMYHDNSGYDIGAFQHAAAEFPCDMMVFFGTTAYIRRPGWLERMTDAFNRHGNRLYGCMDNTGDARFGVSPHLRTTGIWMKPELLKSYPVKVERPEQRYPFEHGPNCLTSWCRKQGKLPLLVTWSGEFDQSKWGRTANGFHRGDQSDLIIGDRLSEPPYYPFP